MRYLRRSIALIVAAALLTLVLAVTAAPAGAQTSCTTPVVTGSHPSSYGGPHFAMDGQWATPYVSHHLDWQFLQVDFGCVGTFEGFRRDMTFGNISRDGNRGHQGEGVSYSVDGVTWIKLTEADASGWEIYDNYAPHAWKQLPLGWSSWLRPDVPVQARYVRYNWDGDVGHYVNEMEIGFTPPYVPPPLGVTLRCDGGLAACTATASGGAGGYSFTWTPTANLTITNTSGSGSVSSIVGACMPGKNYAVRVRVVDADGHSVTRTANRPCTGLPF